MLLLSPFAPHIAEEMWAKLGHAGDAGLRDLGRSPIPNWSNAAVELQEYPVQINGKLRARVMAAPRLGSNDLLAVVKADPDVQRLLANVTVVKEIAVAGRLVNFVVKG